LVLAVLVAMLVHLRLHRVEILYLVVLHLLVVAMEATGLVERFITPHQVVAAAAHKAFRLLLVHQELLVKAMLVVMETIVLLVAVVAVVRVQ
jgi:hypothetical protein